MKANFNIEGADFLDTLLLRHHISLKMVYDCAEKQYDDLATMERIIDLEEEEDVRRFLATARILNPEDVDTIIENLRKEARKQNRNWIADVKEPPLENYAQLIISAFVYNTLFFAMALKKCELLMQSVQHSERQRNDNKIKPFKRVFPKIGGSSSSYRVEYKAASSAVKGFKPFITPSLETAEGVLEFRHAEFDDYFLKFYFYPKTELPDNCVIDVHFIVIGNSHNLRLRKEDDVFTSDPRDGKGIDYRSGIEIKSIEFTEETDNNG